MFKKYLSWLFKSEKSLPTPVAHPAETVCHNESPILNIEVSDELAEAFAEQAVPVKKKRKYYKKKKKPLAP